MKCKVLLILVLTVAIFPFSLRSQQIFDGIAAIVGDEVVLISDINSMITSYAFQNKIDITRQPDLYQKLGTEFLDRLIDQKLILIKADEDTITADDERVEQSLRQQVDYMIKQAGSEDKLVEYYSAPLFKIKNDMRKEIRNQIRVGTLREKRFMNMKISRREVEDFYKLYRDSIPNVQASVKISHILMQITPSESSVQEAFEKIQKLQERLKNGEDFGSLASQFSEDPGSAANGGVLGFVSRGTLVKEFEEVAFSLEKNEISAIVQTQFGFHIIQLLDRQGERINVRHILIQLQPTAKDEERVIENLRQIRNTILAGDSTFEDMAIKYSDDPNVATDKGNLGVFEEGGFQIAEFENAIEGLKSGDISEPFKTDFGYHIVKLEARNDARQFSLDQDWEQIEQWALQNKREREFTEWLAELRQEIPVVVKVEL
jgi:peptidyl-prolyl cis-trans isomerase SurA